jgi:hypothetical protein
VKKFPVNESQLLEVQPGVKVPGTTWEGYKFMARVFWDDDVARKYKYPAHKTRMALIVQRTGAMQALQTGALNMPMLQASIREVLMDDDRGMDEYDNSHKDVGPYIFYEIQHGDKSWEYMVRDEGMDRSYSKYHLKKRYPDTWKKMLYEYQNLLKRASKPAKNTPAEADTSTLNEEESSDIETDVVKNAAAEAEPAKVDENHQGSTMMGSTDGKKMRMKAKEAVEGHGEGGLDTAGGAPKLPSQKYTAKDIADDLPSPDPERLFDRPIKKRQSEPPKVDNVRHRYGAGIADRYSPLLRPDLAKMKSYSGSRLKRMRLSGEIPEVPYVQAARTDTASVAMSLLSKVMENEKMLCEALDEKQVTIDYLESIISNEMMGEGLAGSHSQESDENYREALAELGAQKDENDLLKNEISKLSKEETLLREKLDEAKREAVSKDETLVATQQENKQLRAELDQSAKSQQREIQRIVGNFIQEREDSALKFASMTKTIEDLRRQLEKDSSSQNKVKQLEDSCKDKDAKIKSLVAENNKLKKQTLTKFTASQEQQLVAHSIKMQALCQEYLNTLESADTNTITNFYFHLHKNDDGAASKKPEQANFLLPYYWKDCEIIGARAMPNDLCLTVKYMPTKAIKTYTTREIRKKIYCLDKLAQFFETRVESKGPRPTLEQRP